MLNMLHASKSSHRALCCVRLYCDSVPEAHPPCRNGRPTIPTPNEAAENREQA